MSWLENRPERWSRNRMLRATCAHLVSHGGETVHSAQGLTLPFVIEWLEDAGCPYVLTAQPGAGYVVAVKSLGERT